MKETQEAKNSCKDSYVFGEHGTISRSRLVEMNL